MGISSSKFVEKSLRWLGNQTCKEKNSEEGCQTFVIFRGKVVEKLIIIW